MSLLELFLLAVGLSMDAFAVSVCKGLSVRRGSMKQALTVGIWFGGFQALMPFLGYLLGITFSSLITSIDHWIAFVLLAFIGFNMIREARSDEENESNDRFDFQNHASARCCNQHRRTCRRRYLRFPAGKHRSGSQLHRRNDLSYFGSGSQGWKYLWRTLAERGTDHRWRDFDFAWRENPH